jgi:hypothetical protein
MAWVHDYKHVSLHYYVIHELLFVFYLITRGVWVSLRAPRLFPGSTEHPASPADR